jgi:ATP-dependent Clp protease ATP-binding subunit ClpA
MTIVHPYFRGQSGSLRKQTMNIEKYTDRSRGFIQSAQSLAVRDGHQQFSPLHMLKVLLDDSEGLAEDLIDRAGGNSRAILKATDDTLDKLPKVSSDFPEISRSGAIDRRRHTLTTSTWSRVHASSRASGTAPD